MPTPQELEAKLWKALDSDRTVMLGLDGAEDGHTRPMTAQVEDDRSRIWFFTAKDNALVQALWRRCGPRHRHVRVERARRVRHVSRATERRPTIPPPSSGSGIDSSRRGTRAARPIRPWPCCASMQSAPKSGWRLQPRCGGEDAARRGSAQELPGQGRAGAAGPLTPKILNEVNAMNRG